MSDRPTMDTGVMAVSVNSTFGYGGGTGTPGKAAGVYDGDRLIAQPIDSAMQEQDFVSLPQYWNVNGTSENTDVPNRQP